MSFTSLKERLLQARSTKGAAHDEIAALPPMPEEQCLNQECLELDALCSHASLNVARKVLRENAATLVKRVPKPVFCSRYLQNKFLILITLGLSIPEARVSANVYPGTYAGWIETQPVFVDELAAILVRQLASAKSKEKI